MTLRCSSNERPNSPPLLSTRSLQLVYDDMTIAVPNDCVPPIKHRSKGRTLMALSMSADRRQFHLATVSGVASIVFASLNLGCSRKNATEMKNATDNKSEVGDEAESSSSKSPNGKRYDDPRVKEAHDVAGFTVVRLRTLDFAAEREQHMFNMIRISEYAWAGLLKDLEKAREETEHADLYCRKHGL